MQNQAYFGVGPTNPTVKFSMEDPFNRPAKGVNLVLLIATF